MSQGLSSQDFPLLSPSGTFDSQEYPLLGLTPVRSDTYYRFPIADPKLANQISEQIGHSGFLEESELEFPQNTQERELSLLRESSNLSILRGLNIDEGDKGLAVPIQATTNGITSKKNLELGPSLSEQLDTSSQTLSQASTISLVNSQLSQGGLNLGPDNSQDIDFTPTKTGPTKLSTDESDNNTQALLEGLAVEAWGILVSLNSSMKLVLTVAQDTFTIGRKETCDFTLTHAQVSSKHFSIERILNPEKGQTNEHEKWGYWITDLNSTNGTYLNTKKLKPNQRFPITIGDQIHLRSRKRNPNTSSIDTSFVFIERTTPGEGLARTFVMVPMSSARLKSKKSTEEREVDSKEAEKNGEEGKEEEPFVEVGIHRETLRKYLIKRPHQEPHYSLIERQYYKMRYLAHPALARILEFDYKDAVIISEEGQHGSLELYLRQKSQPFTESQAQHLIRQISEGLVYLHRSGLVHGRLNLNCIRRCDKSNTRVIINALMGLCEPWCSIPSSNNDQSCQNYELQPEWDLRQLGLMTLELLIGGSSFKLIPTTLSSAPGHSYSTKELKAEDLDLVKASLPKELSQDGVDFIARLLFAPQTFVLLLHPWLLQQPSFSSTKRLLSDLSSDNKRCSSSKVDEHSDEKSIKRSRSKLF